MIFTDEQEYIINRAVNHILHDGYEYIDFPIVGSAGTGKSTILFEIIKRIGIPLDKIAPMAYTGQAAVVMRRKGLLNAKTIHSWIYDHYEVIVRDPSSKPVMDPKYNRPKTRIAYRLNENALKDIEYVILDEARMCPEQMAKQLKDFGKKIICCGDTHQCDPIMGKPGFLNDDREFRLTKIMRQVKGSSIIDIAYAYYDGIDVRPGKYGNDVLVIDEEDFNGFLMTASDMTICSYNNTRDDMNQWYRSNIIKTDNPLPELGERVVCKKNNWDIEYDGISLVNGLTGTVSRSISTEDIDTKENTFDLTFRPDNMDVDFRHITCDMEYFKSSWNKRKQMRTDPRRGNEFFEFAYANTVYSAQGSEYPCGIYYREPFNSKTQNKIDYTAITRFSKRIIVVRPKIKRYW